MRCYRKHPRMSDHVVRSLASHTGVWDWELSFLLYFYTEFLYRAQGVTTKPDAGAPRHQRLQPRSEVRGACGDRTGCGTRKKSRVHRGPSISISAGARAGSLAARRFGRYLIEDGHETRFSMHYRGRACRAMSFRTGGGLGGANGVSTRSAQDPGRSGPTAAGIH
jgi:hypothetical protein